MQNEWMISVINLGGIAEVLKLLSLYRGQKLFLFSCFTHSKIKERSFHPIA